MACRSIRVSASSWVLVRCLSTGRLLTYIHDSGLPHRSSRVFLTVKDVRCKIDAQRFLVDITAYHLLERDLFNDSIIGNLVRQRPAVTLTKLMRCSFVERVWKIIATKNRTWTSSHSRDFLSMISRK